MTINLLQIDQRLRKKICPTCVRFTSARTCSLPKDRPCSLFENLAEVVNIVRLTHSRRIDPYIDLLRSRVCSACHFEDEHGSCPCRDNVDCGLDSYFPLIVEVIEDELGRQSLEHAKVAKKRREDTP